MTGLREGGMFVHVSLELLDEPLWATPSQPHEVNIAPLRGS
jgi:hypothetical protein